MFLCYLFSDISLLWQTINLLSPAVFGVRRHQIRGYDTGLSEPNSTLTKRLSFANEAAPK